MVGFNGQDSSDNLGGFSSVLRELLLNTSSDIEDIFQFLREGTLEGSSLV